jgi:hypothetical protein
LRCAEYLVKKKQQGEWLCKGFNTGVQDTCR